MRTIVIDTGPLVALLDRRDQHHSWAVDQAKRLPGPFLTSEPVITEACHLTRDLPAGRQAILDMIFRSELLIPFRLDQEVARVQELIRQYASVPMSLPDACLVRMAEQHPDRTILT